jgi:hypothetical protein
MGSNSGGGRALHITNMVAMMIMTLSTYASLASLWLCTLGDITSHGNGNGSSGDASYGVWAASYLANDASAFTLNVLSPPDMTGSIFFLPAVFRYHTSYHHHLRTAVNDELYVA